MNENLNINKRVISNEQSEQILKIKKKKITSEVDDYDYSEENEEELLEDKDYEESLLMIYQGELEPNGENDKEKFYRCKLKLQKKKDDWWSEFIAFLVLIALIIAFIAFLNRGG